MVQYQLKLKLTKKQEETCQRWLYCLSSVYNFASRKIELNAKNKIYFSKNEFRNLLVGHGKKLEISSHTLQGVLCTVYDAWSRCFKKIGGKPRLKGVRNKLTSIPFPDPIEFPSERRIKLPDLGSIRFHKMDIPEGKIKCGRIVKRASGWYLCLFIDVGSKNIERIDSNKIGIDSGFKSLLSFSNGYKIQHPRELELGAKRLAQAQRGHDKKLAARINERIKNCRKDRNHKLSRKLVSENVLIAFSKDNTISVARKFGKSVASSGHAQLRQMLLYKSPKSGTKYVEVDSKFSTMTCSECGALTGPTGVAGLKVRHWMCPCGAEHDRDTNAARNTLNAALGMSVEVASRKNEAS